MNAAVQQLELTWPATDYQPRYKAYCAAHGRDPVAMAAHDEEAWPGGRMCGYILWIGARWAEWRAANGAKPRDILSDAQIADFDAWLERAALNSGEQQCSE